MTLKKRGLVGLTAVVAGAWYVAGVASGQSPAEGAGATTQPAQQQATGQVSGAVDPARAAAAEELLVALKVKDNLQNGIDQLVDAQVRVNPALGQFRETFRNFIQKYMSWDALRNDLVGIYSTEFSEAELKELSAFFGTPAGQKFAEKQQTLNLRTAMLTQQRIQQHLPELQQAIQAKAEELQKQSGGGLGGPGGGGLGGPGTAPATPPTAPATPPTGN